MIIGSMAREIILRSETGLISNNNQKIKNINRIDSPEDYPSNQTLKNNIE